MRQYKLLEIATQYDQYLRGFYKIHSDIDKLSYDELFAMIANDDFAESDFIHRQLNKMGIESKVIFCNNRNLQDKWHSVQKDISYFGILLLQIKDFAPDVILISDMCFFSSEETAAIKGCMGDGKVKLVGFHFTELNDAFWKDASLYDQIYTGNKACLCLMKNRGLPAYLLRHAFEASILDDIPRYERKDAVCFLGSIFVGKELHSNRLDMLDAIMRSNLPYVFYGNIYGSIQEIISRKDERKYLGIIAEIAKYMEMGVFGREYYKVMGQYGICLNLHAPCAGYGAGNMKMFEATGMGACLLTDYRSENAELFDIANEIVVYDSFEDMAEKAKWLLDNPGKAREIALAGQKRTLAEYTYKNKAECLDGYIQMLMV